MKELRSKAKQAFSIIMEELRIMCELRQKEEEVEKIMDNSDKVLEEVHMFFNKCMDYLHSRASPHALVPVPAWNGIMPSQEEAKRAFERLTELMNEALPLLNDVSTFREQYTLYCKEITAFMQQRTEFVKDIEKETSEKKLVAAISTRLSNMPDYSSRSNELITRTRALQGRVNDIRQKCMCSGE